MRNAELTLKEFLIAVLHRFRMVLLVGVAAAVLAGAFSAYTTRMGIGTWQEEYDVQYAAYQQALASKRTSIEDSQAIAAQAREYNQNSLLMRVDPFNKQVASLSFSVTVPPDVYSVGLPEGKTLNLVDLQASSVQAVTDRYLLLAGSADLGDVLGGVYTGDAKDSYLRELIRVGEFRAEGAPRDQGNSGIVVITATGSRGLDAKAAVDAVFAYLQRQKPLVEQSAVPHDVRVLEESVQIVSDNALAEAQNTQRSLLADNAARVIQLQQEINDLQGRRPRAPSLLFSVAQSAVLGFLLGLVLGTGLAVLAYLAQLPAHYATQMQRQLGMRFLGGAQRPARGIISRWKARLAGEGLLTDQDTAAALAAVTVEDAARGKGRVVVTGTIPEADVRALCDRMSRHLGPRGLAVVPAAGITTSAQAAMELREADAVVIAERLHASRLRDVLAVKERAEASGKPVLGYVLV